VSVSTAAVAALGDGGGAWLVAAAIGTLLNATAAFVAFRVLTVADVPVRGFIPGALFVGVSWTICRRSADPSWIGRCAGRATRTAPSRW
jgi:hypothetical protein